RWPPTPVPLINRKPRLLGKEQTQERLSSTWWSSSVARQRLNQVKCAAGTAELGSCLTDVTRRPFPACRPETRRYARLERFALEIVRASLTRWRHLNLRACLALSSHRRG